MDTYQGGNIVAFGVPIASNNANNVTQTWDLTATATPTSNVGVPVVNNLQFFRKGEVMSLKMGVRIPVTIADPTGSIVINCPITDPDILALFANVTALWSANVGSVAVRDDVAQFWYPTVLALLYDPLVPQLNIQFVMKANGVAINVGESYNFVVNFANSGTTLTFLLPEP